MNFAWGLAVISSLLMRRHLARRLLPSLTGFALAAASAGAAEKMSSTDWWSLRPVARPSVPEIRDASFILRNPVDAFVIAKLKEKGLPQSPEADARTLIRRLYFDLTGLPPTPEEVEAFVREFSSSPFPLFSPAAAAAGEKRGKGEKEIQAYERLVDKLLASPRYGERWARHWLDVVHFGETHGYDKDKPRPNAWPYRDYVIRAFNEDKPYARFVQEQIAGDALFLGTRDGIEALGFIAAGPWDFIGHSEVPETKTDGKIARHLDRDDMVANTINTFCSLTVHCAQCHNHKFDPISQEDYYALQAVFAAVDRTELKYFADDKLNAQFRDLQRRQLEASNTITALEQPLKQMSGEKLSALNRRIAGASAEAAKKQGNPTPDFGYHSAISPTQDAVKWVQVDLGRRVSIESVALLSCYDDFNGIGAGFGFPVRFKVETSDDPEFKSGVTLLWRKHDATFMNDFPNPQLRAFTTGGAKDDGIAGRYVRVTAVRLAPRKNDFIFALAELQVFDRDGTNVALGRPVTALDSIEAPPRWRKANLTDGLAPEAHSADEREKLVKERDALLLGFADELTKAKLAAAKTELQRVAGELKKLPKPNSVYAAGIHHGSGSFRGTGPDGGKPRTIQVLARGDVKSPIKEIGAGALEALQPLRARFALPSDADESARRAALAKWLTDERNPLVWRSIVNRVWQYHFGRGLVETPNDFGKMGALPTHPELLDWLAVTFRDDFGGSLKKLHKLIVMSATYRQRSDGVMESWSDGKFAPKLKPGTPSLHHSVTPSDADADNRFLWRQNRRKLEAEAVRDSVLFVSGKLDLKMGGPSFQDFVIEKPEHSPHYQYHLADPENPALHRRSVYRFLVRSQQQPWMATMDCADPSMLVDKRNQSISPLQALALLNNQLMVTMAKHFAVRVENAGDVAAQVREAFRLALTRQPSDAELKSLTAYAQKHGVTNACRVILNLNEFVFVD
ncbi:MAG: DUF1553 domain-containing protein [Verrucomicrobia bacterium]|nr:DUF1553 domain-containing protein [Verrucomicrobiota bacterium]